MALVSGYIEAPSQGITQAAQQIRLASQATDLQDCLVEIPEGHRKRPPLDLLGKLASITALSDNATLTLIEDPDDGSLVFLVINPESGVTTPRLYAYPALTPIAVTVSSTAQTYLNTNAPVPKADIGITQAVDYTILTNRKVVVAQNTTPNGVRSPEGLIFVKTAGFGKKYQMTIAGGFTGSPIVASVTTPNGNDAADALWADTDKIAQGLAGSGYSYVSNQAACTPGQAALVTGGFTISISGPVIYLSNSVDFTITIQDSQGGTAMNAVKDTVTAFSDLPNGDVPTGFVIKIDPTAAEGSLPSGAYYLEFTNTSSYSGNVSHGVWKETVGPGSLPGFVIADMPVGLIKTGGVWGIDVLPWTNRTVGDEKLSPDPDFVGNTIQDVGLCFDRLALVSGEECFFCAVDNPFRCYPSTMTTEIDSDPFSRVTPGASRAHFYSIIPFNKTFILFGRRKQAVIVPPVEGPVTPTSTRLEILTSYETTDIGQDHQLNLRPTFSDRYAYYPMLRGPAYYAIYEIALDRLSNQPLSEDLTPHIPRFVPSGVDRAATVQPSFLIVYGQSGSPTMYAHLFRYGGSGANYQRLQNGWHQWNLPTGWTLSGITQRGSMLHYLLKYSDGTAWMATQETSPLARDPDPSATIQTLLDVRLPQSKVTRSYNAATNLTAVTLPNGIQVTDLTRIAACTPVVSQPEGYLGHIDHYAGSVLYVQGDWTATNFYVGYKYVSVWTLSTIFYVGQDQRPLHNGTLNLRKLKVDLSQTSFLGCQTAVGNRTARNYSLKQNSIGTPMIYTGYWEVPLAGSNLDTRISFINDSHVPHRITGFEWFGEFVAKSQRVT